MMVVLLSIFQITNGNNDLAFAPMSEKGLLPKPLTCAADARKIPNCLEAVKHLKFHNITKECCTVLLGLPDDCLGKLFSMRFIYNIMLKITCNILGVKPPLH